MKIEMSIEEIKVRANSWHSYSIRLGDTGYFGNSATQLQLAMERGRTHKLIGVQDEADTNVQSVFIADDNQAYGLYIPENTRDVVKILEDEDEE